ncbi:MAG TPA: hypothetical protein VFT82_04370 [Candidatus Paceibacterota bacterium]|nr:hypothetical protein [Candidatus Paceibacterota bacterium]
MFPDEDEDSDFADLIRDFMLALSILPKAEQIETITGVINILIQIMPGYGVIELRQEIAAEFPSSDPDIQNILTMIDGELAKREIALMPDPDP